MPLGFSGNLIFAIIAQMLCGNHLNSLYLPIFMYGSEVWNIYNKYDYNLWKKDLIEKTHLSFCKQVLGINKQWSNVACRNELGRLPLKEITESDINVIKFWIHLENQPENSIAERKKGKALC